MGVAEAPPQDPDGQAHPPLELPGQAVGAHGLAGRELHPRQLPEPGQEPLRGALADQDPAPVAEEPQEEHPFLHGAPPARRGDLGGQALDSGLAEGGDGAGGAAGPRAREAKEGAQIHDGLVPLARGLGGHQPPSQGLHLAPAGRIVPGAPLAAPPAQDPEGIAVHGGQGHAEGDAEDRPGRVRPHPREAAEALGIGGHLAPFPNQLPGRLVEEAGPAVEAQPFPRFEDLVFVGGGQGGQIGEPLEKPVVVGNDPLHLGLLEHHLREPDPVGIPGLPPGQSPAVLPVPSEQGGVEGLAPAGRFRLPAGQLRQGSRGVALGDHHEGADPSGRSSLPAAASRNQGISPDSQAALPRMMMMGASRSPGSPKRVVAT